MRDIQTAINVALHEATEKLAPTRQLRRLLIDEGGLPVVAQAVGDVAEAYLTSLSSQVATLTEAVSKKDEALRQFLIGAKHESCMYAPEDPDPTWHCCDWSQVVEQVEAALSLSPASVAEEAANARVGKAVEELLVGPFEINGTSDFQCGYAQALRWVTQAVNKAKESSHA